MTPKRGRYRKAAYEVHAGGFRYRRAVPASVRELVGRKFWLHSFGKVSPTEAAARAHELTARHQRQIAVLKALSQAERREIIVAGGVDAWVQQGDYDSKMLPFIEGAAGVGLPDSELRDPDADEDRQDLQTLEVIKARRVYERVKGEIERARAFRKRIEGDIEGAALLGIVDVWEKVKPPQNYKTAEKARLYVARFVEVIGDLKPREVTRAHAVRFRDVLHQRGTTSASVDAHLAKLNALFNVALGENLVDHNPFQRVRAHKEVKKHSEGRQGFDGGQIKRILVALKGETDDFAWAVRLLIYHGARSGEIAQLKVSDVSKLHGIDVIRIHDRHGRVKNKFSVRDVPIHPKCAGIVAYARAVEKEHGPEAWIFQSFEAQKQGRAHKFQIYFGRGFLRSKLKITESCYTLHSLRHSFRTACREASVPEAVSRALMGHSMGGGEHGAYGTGPSMKLRKEWIANVDPLKG